MKYTVNEQLTLNSGERVLVVSHDAAAPIYGLKIMTGNNQGSEIRLTEREMVLNGARRLA